MSPPFLMGKCKISRFGDFRSSRVGFREMSGCFQGEPSKGRRRLEKSNEIHVHHRETLTHHSHTSGLASVLFRAPTTTLSHPISSLRPHTSIDHIHLTDTGQLDTTRKRQNPAQQPARAERTAQRNTSHPFRQHPTRHWSTDASTPINGSDHPRPSLELTQHCK